MPVGVNFFEGQVAFSQKRLSNNRSVMPFDVRGRTRATLKESACVPHDPKGPGNPLNLLRARDWELRLLPRRGIFNVLLRSLNVQNNHDGDAGMTWTCDLRNTAYYCNQNGHE